MKRAVFRLAGCYVSSRVLLLMLGDVILVGAAGYSGRWLEFLGVRAGWGVEAPRAGRWPTWVLMA